MSVESVSITQAENGFVVQAFYKEKDSIIFIAKNYKEIQKTLAKVFDQKEPSE